MGDQSDGFRQLAEDEYIVEVLGLPRGAADGDYYGYPNQDGDDEDEPEREYPDLDISNLGDQPF